MKDLNKEKGKSLYLESASYIEEINILDSFYDASKRVTPLWDIRDYVAVNPFFGFRDKSFLEVSKYLNSISGRSIIAKKEYFLKKYEAGEISEYDLEVSIKLNQNLDKEVTAAQLIEFIKSEDKEIDNPQVKCLSDLYDLENDQHHKANITNKITHEVSKWASAYFDEGQALWKVESPMTTFYSWWKSLVVFDKPVLGKGKGFANLINNLPDDPKDALGVLTEKLLDKNLGNSFNLSDYYYRLMFLNLGWSSYIQKFEFEANRSGDRTKVLEVGSLIDILVIRMAYDLTLIDEIEDLSKLNSDCFSKNNDIDLLYIWLTAAEYSYRRNIENIIKQKEISDSIDEKTTRPAVQMAFCIDVRSEILRRHLENSSSEIQTIGFAGFFGMPVSIKGLGHRHADQNCPILLNANYQITESGNGSEEELISKKRQFVENHYSSKSVQSSANSGFSFAETFGFKYIGKILKSGLKSKRPNIDLKNMTLSPIESNQVELDLSSLSTEEKVNLSFGALKNMGIKDNIGKYVFFIGHGSETSNNPYASALDCGACAGHNGEDNAKILTSFLNDKAVRRGLEEKGVSIPSDSIFFSGWHNTVRDEIKINRTTKLNENQERELEKYQQYFFEASMNCRKERASKLPNCSDLSDEQLIHELMTKANDWSEIRPEWGLARNASFIVGRRELTRKLDLDGRAFLHDYDQSTDKDLSILELIMTAPMVVTNWINMQYYASTVDPKKYGAGNKALNNVVGGIGCIQGNESDLMGGLTEQSVYYNGDYYHEPLRLQVFLEASCENIETIINKHEMVNQLVNNRWLTIISIDPNTKDFKLYQNKQWIQVKEDLWN